MFLLYLLLLLLVLLVIVDWRKCDKMNAFYEQTKSDYFCLPFIGHLYLFMGNSEDWMNRIKELARQGYRNIHGIITIWMGHGPYTFISDAESAKLVLKYCMDKGHLTTFSRHLLGNGSIFAPVNIWRRRRKILLCTTSPKHINQFFAIFVRNSSAALEELKSVAGKGDFSIWNYFCSYTLNSACETVYGEDLQLQKNLQHPFFYAFVEYLKNVGARVFQFWLHSDAVYKQLPVYKKQMVLKNVIHEFCENLINRRKELLKARQSDDNIHNNDNRINFKALLDLLIQFSGEAKEYTTEELLEESLVLLLAATDISAAAGCYTLLLLAQNPEVQDKVYKEIQEVFGDLENELTLIDAISKLEYMDAVVKESLRFYPPAPIIARRCDRDLLLPSGIVLYENSDVVINIWGMHRNPRCWGADADQFRPERFLSATPEQLYAFMPFSYGNRNCLGYRYAMLLIKVMLVTILRRYRLKPATSYPYDNGFRVEFGIIMKHVDNFKIQIEDRN